MSARILMIGLDGADGQLLDKCSGDGSLPNLAALRKKGRARRLSSFPSPTDDALWASFQYAADLGEHGRINSWNIERDGQISKAHWKEKDRLAFWDKLSAQGQRVAVFDVPKCRNPRPVNGIHLADWLVHGRYFPKPRSQPHSLAPQVVGMFGKAPPSRCNYYQDLLSDREVSEICKNLSESTAMKRAAGLHYLSAEDWDLFVICFKEAHCASHAFLDFEPAHPGHDPARRARLGDPIMSVLLEIDHAVGDLVAAAGPLAEVLVFSPSDFQPNGILAHLLPAIVKRLNGQLADADDQPAEHRPGPVEVRVSPPACDWHCEILPYNENCGALRLTRGRSSGGDSATGTLPDKSVSDRVEELLWTLRDAEAGTPVISAITRPASELVGSQTASLPDLLLHWTSGYFPTAIVSSALGEFRGDSPAWRPGNHAAGGFAIATGARLADAIGKVRTMADLGSLPGAVLV